jgi:vitamin B12 transporter
MAGDHLGQIFVLLFGAADRFDSGLSLNAVRTDGTNVSRFGSEVDGYRNNTVFGSARWQPTPVFSLNATLRWRDSRSQFDPQDFSFPPGPTYGLIIDGDRETDSKQLDARLRGQLSTLDGQLEHQFGLARSKTKADNFANGVFSSGSEGTRTLLDYQGSLRFGGSALPQVLTLAVERERLEFVNQGPTPTSAQNQSRDSDRTGLALEYRVRLPSQTALTLSGRSDRNDLLEGATTYRFTVAQPIGKLKLRASAGTGVANPTFFELFGFIPGSFDPNPNLKPEKSFGFDVGADLSVPGSEGGDDKLRVLPEQVAWLEERCDEVNAGLEPLKSFVLPGGTPAAAQLHVCRTVFRGLDVPIPRIVEQEDFLGSLLVWQGRLTFGG